ncbi:PREDICTED: inaD-like protein [Priapulus caudatus]|uniref:InaD-like protein n=1 Tax=Priapulus caudatus TaxID=37621 RepID=A0ABM1EFB5_PRICU|nr:PREDICTED: inaD-like protein [Priapulus caudatus]
MPISEDTRRALQLLEKIQVKLKDSGDPRLDEDLNTLISVLESPIFRQIITLQESVQELKRQVTRVPSLNPEDFDISPTGELILSPVIASTTPSTDDGYNDGDTSQRKDRLTTPQRAAQSPERRQQQQSPPLVVTQPSYGVEFQKAVAAAAYGRDVLRVQLSKSDHTSLGFGVVGLKSEHRGELGIFVQDIQPGGIAAR